MSKYKKPKVGFLDHVAGKSGQPDPIDEVLKEAAENPVPKTETKKKTQKKPVIKEEKQNLSGGMESYVTATKVDPTSAKGSFDDKAVEGYVPPVIEQTKPEVNARQMTAYQKAVKEREERRKSSLSKIEEVADLMGGEQEKPVTQAELRQLKVSLASLGGGGLGENDVIELINKYGADSIADILDSGQIQQIIEAIRQ